MFAVPAGRFITIAWSVSESRGAQRAEETARRGRLTPRSGHNVRRSIGRRHRRRSPRRRPAPLLSEAYGRRGEALLLEIDVGTATGGKSVLGDVRNDVVDQSAVVGLPVSSVLRIRRQPDPDDVDGHGAIANLAGQCVRGTRTGATTDS